jgi:hypothetical protein
MRRPSRRFLEEGQPRLDLLNEGELAVPGPQLDPDRDGDGGDHRVNGAQMHEVREFAGHSDIRTTELYFVRRGEDAELAARRIQIRVPGRPGG